jgi:hypothetical protein
MMAASEDDRQLVADIMDARLSDQPKPEPEEVPPSRISIDRCRNV